MKLLIIEDERELSDSIASYLTREDNLCEQAFNYREAADKIGIYEYDCILLDLMLPGGSGLDLLREIKRQGVSSGVIIVSAKDSVEDKVEGLRIGADDYIAKPFSLPELSMRVFALARRRNFSNGNVLVSDDLTVDLLSRQVSRGETILNLTKTEYELMLFLIENRGRVVAKEAIAEHLSGDMADMMDDFNFVYAHLKNLKAKLSAAGCGEHIKTYYGIGYKWEE